MTIYTVEAQAHDGSGVVSLYAASDKLNTAPTDTPANQHFTARLKVSASFERALFRGGGTGTGAPQISFGEIVLANADGGLDAWADYAFDGRPCVVKAVEPGGTYASAMILIRGRVESVDVTDLFRTIRFRLYDPLVDLDRPLLTTAYAGTTNAAGQGAEGTTDLAATIKPRVYGVRNNVAPINVNPYDLIYQVSDKAVAVITVYDGGAALTNAGDSATVAALASATIASGSYRTCLALGLFRLGGQSARAVTADVRVGATTERSAARIAQAILLDAGVPAGSLDPASFDGLHAAAPAPCGTRLQGDGTVLAALTEVLRSVGAWIITTAQGLYQVGRFAGPGAMPVASFAEWQLVDDVERLATGSDDSGIPTWRVVVRYGRLGVVQNDGDLVGVVTAARRGVLAQEWREAVAESPSTKARWLTARVLTVETGLATQADAQAEANRLLALFATKRTLWRIKVSNGFALGVELGETVNLTLARYLATGGNLVVTGRIDDANANSVQLDLWG